MVIMGIGREGNIGMNEPGSHASSTTRLILVDATSRSEAARNIGVDNLPPCSITWVSTPLWEQERFTCWLGEKTKQTSSEAR